VVPFSIANQFRQLRADDRGAVSVMMGFLLIPLVGFLGIGFEVSNWYLITRGMQNAADAATIAAAVNNGANYDVEARAVAAQYGFLNGANNVSVAVTNAAACPGGGNTCYSVTISGYTPLLLSQIVGFQGDANFNGTPEKKLTAVAVAKQNTVPQDLCLLALASSGVAQGIRTNGSPTANMNGCDSMSNTAAQCNGSNLGLGISLPLDPTVAVALDRCRIPRWRTPTLISRAIFLPSAPAGATEITRRNRSMGTATRWPQATSCQGI
jgi:Flp pilus assembly protein TadG